MSDKALKNQLARLRAAPAEAERRVRYPACPAHLEAPERQLWRKTLRDFELADGCALAVLETTLTAHMRARRCRESINRIGELVKDSKGGVRAHPLLCHERDARAAFLAGMRALGVLGIE